MPASAEKNVEAAADDPYADIEGPDEPTRQALKVPAIREAVEKEFTKAAETQQAYTVALQQGQQVARATIAALAPQLDGIPARAMARSDPGDRAG